ncbi:MAG: FtsH protease activity modulator HflK [Acidobacteriota bacterium]|nr:FtsH protease activity modulator HflK [Acidobacteriota bacterium]MDH3784743.1 FtsH protease activity modulator HflK [Acidobacteriota bacterium]
MSDPNIRGVPRPPNFKPPQFSPRWILTAALGIVVLVMVFSMGHSIQPEELGVVTTFGSYSRTIEPGFRVTWPAPIQKVQKVPVQRQLKQEFGFRTVRADTRSQFDSRSFAEESLMLTGDLNVAEVSWITQYRIDDPFKYLFKVDRVSHTFRDMNEAIMRAVIGDRSVTEVLTVGRQEIASEVEVRLQELCDSYETGIKVDQIVLQDVTPPDEVKPSFNEVNQAQQEKERLINEARSEFNRIIPRARGEAQQVLQEAEGYATNRVNRAKGDAALFNELLSAYKRAPDVTRRRIYLEAMQDIYPTIKTKVVIDADLKGLLPLLNLGGETKP